MPDPNNCKAFTGAFSRFRIRAGKNESGNFSLVPRKRGNAETEAPNMMI